MNWFIHKMLGHYPCEEAGADGVPASGATPPPASTPPPAGSVLANAAPNDYIPEKYRVTKDDGSLDLEQSSRKLAESYSHLEKRLGSGDAPPKSPEEYAVKLEGVEDFNWDEFKADESTQSFLKGAHAKGLTNDQVQYVIGEYMKAAPGLIEGGAVLTTQDCTATLKAAWGDDAAIRTNVTASYRAAEAFASPEGQPGNFNTLMSKYGNDPDFIAFTANIGKELREDSQINGGAPVSEGDFKIKTAELRQQLQDLPAHDPKRPGVQAQLDALYNQRFGKPQSRLG